MEQAVNAVFLKFLYEGELPELTTFLRAVYVVREWWVVNHAQEDSLWAKWEIWYFLNDATQYIKSKGAVYAERVARAVPSMTDRLQNAEALPKDFLASKK